MTGDKQEKNITASNYDVMYKVDFLLSTLQAKNYQVIIRNDQIGNVYSIYVYKYVKNKKMFHKNCYIKERIDQTEFMLPEQVEKLEQYLEKFI